MLRTIWDMLFSRAHTQKLRVRGDVDGLVRLLRDPLWIVRANAAEALWQPDGVPPGDSRAVEPLIRVMRTDDSARVRRDAAVALGRHWKGDPKALQPLIEALKNDENPDVRRDAAWALGKQGNPQATLQPLMAALQSDEQHVQNVCAEALEELGELSAAEPLRNAGFEKAARRIEERSGY